MLQSSMNAAGPDPLTKIYERDLAVAPVLELCSMLTESLRKGRVDIAAHPPKKTG